MGLVRKLMWYWALGGFTAMLVSCSSILDKVVVDRIDVLKDGEFSSFKLEPGTYKLELTASNDGASVEWIGANCPGSGETKTYSSICEFAQTGQLIIKNPTVFGSGYSTSVTIKITKLAR
jgi:hypothetical protein